MNWNHRVVKRRVVECGEEIDWFGIHEVFYGLDGGTAWTNEPVAVDGESVEELRETLERMLRALDTPIIDDTGNKK